jgi:cytoskeletal protein CcmA (bactofilin family)
METPNAPHGETTLIGQSIVIKGELSCGEDLFIDGQVEGAIDPKGNRLTIGPNGVLKQTSRRAPWSCRVSWRAAFKPVTGLT